MRTILLQTVEHILYTPYVCLVLVIETHFKVVALDVRSLKHV